MKKMKMLAVSVFAVVGFSGCASTQIADLARVDAAPAQAAEQKVSRALPSYGSMGGYRYRRFAAVAAAS
ncbi:MAG: hypothetical protein AABM33_10810 [Pseudomonadota bacterium]